MTAPVIELRGASRTVALPDGTPLEILQHVDLTVQPGEVVAIKGRSGAGKSTLLNILGLLDTPTAGSYRWLGQEVLQMDDRTRSRLRGASIGFVFQAYQLLDRRTAVDNVAEPLLYSGWRSIRKRRDVARSALTDVGLGHRCESMPHQLSGGEQQRVALARALVRSPAVILADEPTGSLDADTGELVMRLLLELARKSDTAVVLVTHDEAVATQADRVVTIASGRLQEAG